MLLIGTVLKAENISGHNAEKSWDFWQITVWDGDSAHACMVGRDLDPRTIGQGEDVVLDVAVNPRRNSRSGAYENSVTILRVVTPDQLLDRLPVLTAARAA